MRTSTKVNAALGIAVIAAVAMSGERALTQPADPNSAPNPYRLDENWAKPEGRKFGQVIAVEVDRDGKSVWAFDRCGGTSCQPVPWAHRSAPSGSTPSTVKHSHR